MNSFFPRFILTLVLLGTLAGSPARAQVYIAYLNSGVISKYDQGTGAVISDMFVLGLKSPHSLCIAHGVLYVLQTDSGTVGTYNAETGAAIRPDLVGSLNTPQSMAVDGDTIYVADFDWQTHQPRIGKYNAFTGAVINPAFKVFGEASTGMIINGMAPTSLAASGNKLFVAGGNGPNGVHEYDATTGEPIKSPYTPILSSSFGFASAGHWLFGAVGYNAPTGCVIKMDMNLTAADMKPEFFPSLYHPLVRGLDYPTRVAISGDDLFIGCGGGTAIGKYNATSGAVINATFIPSLHDRLGGLAVMPRDLTSHEMSADADFNWHQDLSHFAFMAMLHASSLIAGASIVFAVGMGVLVTILIRRKAALPVATESGAESPVPVEAAPAPEIVEEPALPITETEAPVEPQEIPDSATAAPPRSFSTIALVASVLGVTTLVAFAVMGYLVMQPVEPVRIPDASTLANLVGIWRYENDTREASQRPVFLSVEIYTDKINFSEGNGPNEKSGSWHDDGFWIKNDDGSGETEVARIVDPVDIEVHAGAFIPSRSDVPVLYKVMGSAAEKAAIAAKYPGPVAYPPPKGVITYYMTEYDLNSLPWKADSLEVTGESYSRGLVYHYHSDNPQIPALEVTVKNRKVVSLTGGYE